MVVIKNKLEYILYQAEIDRCPSLAARISCCIRRDASQDLKLRLLVRMATYDNLNKNGGSPPMI